MKIGRFMALAVIAVGLAMNHAFAHTSSFRAQVPFNFVVANHRFPPGDYIVQRLWGKILESTGVVVIESSDHRVYRAVITRLEVDRPLARVKVSKLLFTTFQGQQYLSRICVAGDAMEDQLSTPGNGSLLEARPAREVKLVSLR